MNKHTGTYRLTYTVGQWLVFLLQLNFIWLFFVLKGGILFGLFPASTAMIQTLFYRFERKEAPLNLWQYYSAHFSKHFKEANILGYIYLSIMLLLYVDLRVAGQLIQNRFVHGSLLVLFIFSFFLGLHLFTCFARYELTIRHYFKQSFFLMISSILETIAIVLGIFLATAISTLFPILMILTLSPLILLPMSYFSLQAMHKIEKNNQGSSSIN